MAERLATRESGNLVRGRFLASRFSHRNDRRSRIEDAKAETCTAIRRYRVVGMEPLVGRDRADERTQAAPSITSSAPDPSMGAAEQFEGQEGTLEQLPGMGRVEWESQRVMRLHTASESYRVELEPVGPPSG